MNFRGRQHTKLQYAVLASAPLHGGTEPDLLDEVAWWQTGDFRQYARCAAIAYTRAAASWPAREPAVRDGACVNDDRHDATAHTRAEPEFHACQG